MFSPTQAPEGRGCPGVDMMNVNRPDFILRGDCMAWWVWLGIGFIAGSIFGIMLLAIMASNGKDDRNE